jgi:prolyl oligopeptidase
VESGRDREDLLEWVKFSGASWARDGSGFYYSRYDAPKAGAKLTGLNEFQKLYFHRIGRPQAEDELLYERKDHKDWGFHGEATEDGRYLVITVTKGADPRNALFYRDLQDSSGEVVELISGFDSNFSYVGNDGPLFYLNTDFNAPRSRVVQVDLREPQRNHWRELIPQAPEPLKDVSLIGQRLLCEYLKDAHSAIKVYELRDTTPARYVTELKLPGLGSVSGLGGDRTETETFFHYTSYTVAGSVYRLDVPTLKTELFRKPNVDFAPELYETRQIFYHSADGTRVPMFITAKRGLKLEGSHPTLLYGYGGFNISLTPYFGVRMATWLERGGVFAVANLRGGGEYGMKWHEAGTKARKQNVFDDFIAAAEYLVREKYTRPARLGILGGSNGGLLVGACMTQRPDLFGAAVPAVGVLDMLRYHKFTIGWAWTNDYGSSDVPEEFPTLLAYSPLHHLREGIRYPATLVTTSDHDDRVVPAHSFKFAARLQACQVPGGPPVLIRIETKAGHGAGTALAKVIDATADELAFLWEQLAR